MPNEKMRRLLGMRAKGAAPAPEQEVIDEPNEQPGEATTEERPEEAAQQEAEAGDGADAEGQDGEEAPEEVKPKRGRKKK